jgi:hypothetical protein
MSSAIVVVFSLVEPESVRKRSTCRRSKALERVRGHELDHATGVLSIDCDDALEHFVNGRFLRIVVKCPRCREMAREHTSGGQPLERLPNERRRNARICCDLAFGRAAPRMLLKPHENLQLFVGFDVIEEKLPELLWIEVGHVRGS